MYIVFKFIFENWGNAYSFGSWRIVCNFELKCVIASANERNMNSRASGVFTTNCNVTGEARINFDTYPWFFHSGVWQEGKNPIFGETSGERIGSVE